MPKYLTIMGIIHDHIVGRTCRGNFWEKRWLMTLSYNETITWKLPGLNHTLDLRRLRPSITRIDWIDYTTVSESFSRGKIYLLYTVVLPVCFWLAPPLYKECAAGPLSFLKTYLISALPCLHFELYEQGEGFGGVT